MAYSKAKLKSMSVFLKHHGFAAFLITIGFTISSVIKPQRETVNLSSECFTPVHLSPFKQRVLLGNAPKIIQFCHHLQYSLDHIVS
jgi:hypothetical protein